MKKFLILGLALTFTTTTTFTSVEVKQALASKASDLKNLIKVSNLGVIEPDFPGKNPSIAAIKNRIKKLNSKVDINKIEIINQHFLNHSNCKIVATIIPVRHFYHNQQTISFTIPTGIDLTTLITQNANIGLIKTHGAPMPTADQVKQQLTTISQYQNINWDLVTINNPNTTSAIIKGDGNIYLNSVQVQYQVDPKIALSDIIVNNNISSGFATAALHRTEQDILKALAKIYPKLYLKKILVQNITENSATIVSNDESWYTGTVQVNFSVPLNLIITKTNLANLNLPNNNPTAEEIKAGIQKINPVNINKININNIHQVKTLTQDSFAYQADVISNDSTFYSGDAVKVNFNVNLSQDLTKIITQTDLGTIDIAPPAKIPNDSQIIAIIHQNYPILDRSNIKVSSITNQTAIISGADPQVFTNQVTVHYQLNESVPLNDVVTTLNLAKIDTNGQLLPSSEQIVNAIKTKNPVVDTNHISISQITTNSALVTGDKVVYQGCVTVNFEIINQTINQDFQFKDGVTYSASSSDSPPYTSATMTLLANWKQYGQTWNDLIQRFHTVTFGQNSELSIFINTYTGPDQILTGNAIHFNLADITNQSKPVCSISYNYDPGGFFHAKVNANLNLNVWHDDNDIKINVDWSAVTSQCYRDRVFTVSLQNFVIN